MLRLAASSIIASSLWCMSGCSSEDSRAGEDRRAAADLFTAARAWFAPMEMEDDLSELVDELERHSMTPSRVFQRTEGWTEISGTKRTLQVSGHLDGDTYTVVSGQDMGALVEPGDYRGKFTLEKLRGEQEYRWIGDDTACLGDVPLTALVRAVEAVLVELERDDLRDVLQVLPRTKATWGRLAKVRVADRREAPGGGTALTVELEIDPEGIEREFPAFSRYLKKFVRPVEMVVEVRDESSAIWMRMRLERLTTRVELRSRDGRLAPLAGDPRMLPEDLYLRLDLSTKAGPFRVGFRALEIHLRFERARERIALGFLMSREPEWRIPFIVEPFVSGALHRPFEGDGIESRFAFLREPDDRTLLNNDFRFAVEETWLLRRLGGSFGREFDEDVELERRKFYEAAILALRDDLFERLAVRGRDGGGGRIRTAE